MPTSLQTLLTMSCTTRKSPVYSSFPRTDISITSLHHTRLPSYVRDMKKYHLAHHYKNFDLGFGVTSKIWDYVFNTVLVV